MIDDIAARLRELPGIIAVNVVVNTEQAVVSIVAVRSVPFDEIANLTEDVDHVEVIVARPLKDQPARFRSEPGMAGFFHTRWGGLTNPGEAKDYAEYLGIEKRPILNALVGDRLGIMFATVADAERFDGIRAGTIRPALAELTCRGMAGAR